MKKLAAILFTVLMVISLAACGGEKEPAEERESGTIPEEGKADDGQKVCL